MRLISLPLIIFSILIFSCSDNNQWKRIDDGISIIQFHLLRRLGISAGRVDVVKIDPNYYQLQLLCASQHGHKKRTVKEWCEEFHLTGAINAGMYKMDSMTSVGYMKNFTYLNNDHIVQDYMAVLAFNPVHDSLPPVQIIDREFQDFDNLKKGYNSLMQSIRMVDSRGKNVWSRQPQKHTIAALAIDKDGNVLFIFCEQPYGVHDFINFLLERPLAIHNVIYLEGGPPAQFYLKTNDLKIDRKGQDNYHFTSIRSTQYTIPNVIGIVKKPPSK
ncbi:MAG: phosphodiester glycosidase family protein, partial [Calditrichaeota bacterium]|nr:phosphodiester glycosidase family protein [Calditrichota bacterium]